MPRRPRARLRLAALEDRLTPAGWLDPTFGDGGVAGTGLSHPLFWSEVDLAALPDGRLVVVGETENDRTQVVRLNPDGSPDASFGTAGVVTLPADQLNPVAVAAGPAGAVYVLTSTSNGTGNYTPGDVYSAGQVTRLTAAGGLDPTFSGDGVASVWDTHYSYGAGLAVRPDGSALVTDMYGQSGVELTPAGGRAGTFAPTAPDGISLRSTAGLYPTADGGLVVVSLGERTPAGGAWQRVAVVSRFTAAGQLDAGFGTAGQAVFDLPGADGYDARVVPLGLDPAGRLTLVLAGRPTVPGGTPVISYHMPVTNTVVRLTPAGQLDPTFGGDGAVGVTVPGDRFVITGGVLADGRVLVLGNSPVGQGMAAHLLAADGTAGPGLADGGWLALAGGPLDRFGFGSDYGPGWDNPTAVVLPDGRVAVTGRNTPPGYAGNPVLAVAVIDLTAETPAGGVYGETPPPPEPPVTDPGGDAITSIVPPLLSFEMTGYVCVYSPSTGPIAPSDLRAAGSAEGRAVPAGVPSDDLKAADTVATDGPRVSVVAADGRVILPAFAPFEAMYTGTLNAVLIDVDGDGVAELVVSPNDGGGPVVAVFRLDGTEVGRFWGIDDVGFRGGVRLAAGDVNNDDTPDLVVTAGDGGGPRVAVFDGQTLGADARRLVADFFAFEAGQRGGAYAAVADGTLVFGAGPGGGPRVRTVYAGSLLAAGGVGTIDELPADARWIDRFIGDPAARNGARVSVRSDGGRYSGYEVLADAGDGGPQSVFVGQPAGPLLPVADPLDLNAVFVG